MTAYASTATSLCATCDARIAATTDGNVWEAVDVLARKRAAAGWITRDAQHYCPACIGRGRHLPTDTTAIGGPFKEASNGQD